MNYFATSIITFVINHSHIETVLAKFTIFIKKKKQDEKLFGKVPPSKFRTPITNAVPWFTSWSPSKNLDVSQLKSMLN